MRHTLKWSVAFGKAFGAENIRVTFSSKLLKRKSTFLLGKVKKEMQKLFDEIETHYYRIPRNISRVLKVLARDSKRFLKHSRWVLHTWEFDQKLWNRYLLDDVFSEHLTTVLILSSQIRSRALRELLWSYYPWISIDSSLWSMVMVWKLNFLKKHFVWWTGSANTESR